MRVRDLGVRQKQDAREDTVWRLAGRQGVRGEVLGVGGQGSGA